MKKYPKLIGAIHTVFRLTKGALIVDRETATHFCSVKVNGEDDRKKKWLYSEEYQSEVDRNMYGVLVQLGFKPTVLINMTKYYCEGGIEIQKVRDLGLFMEIEGKNRKECWKKIKKTGIKVSEELNIGKPEMMWRRNGKIRNETP